MDGSVPSGGTLPQQVNLQTLNSIVQQAVQAQNLIATRIAALTTEQTTGFADLTAAFNTAFPAPLSSSATWNPASVATGAETSTTVTVAGAALGNYVQASFSLDLQALTLTGYISATNTVTVVLANNTAGAVDLGSGTLKVRVTTV